MSGPLDTEVLRCEVQDKHSEIAEKPDGTHHFHMGRVAAERAGYNPAWLDLLPSVALESFAGVANPFHRGPPKQGEHVLDQRVGPEKATAVLGWWAAASMAEGLERTIDWYRGYLGTKNHG